MIRQTRTIIIAFACVLLSACSPAQTSDLKVPRWDILKTGSQCGSANAEVRWLLNQDELQAVWVDRTVLGDSPQASLPSQPDHWLLYLSNGQKPTAGYSINVNGVRRVDAATLELIIDWAEPQKGKMMAQMVTKPCVILAVEKGSYSKVKFINQSGTSVTLSTPK